MLDPEVRTTLIGLTVAVIIMLGVSLYLVKSKNRKDDLVLNNRIHVLQAGGSFEEGFQDRHKKQKNLVGRFDYAEMQPPINASQLVPAEWNSLVDNISGKYSLYDVFVIVHGKETMTYTAAALAFMLENLNKPVILVDGEVMPALIAASSTRIPEVMIFSGGRLLRGCKTVASSTSGFTSPNHPALTSKTCLAPATGAFTPRFVNPKTKVRVMRVFPGMDGKHVIDTMTREPANGVVFQVYGVGKGPADDEFLGVISALAKKGVVMVSVSQSDAMDTIPYEPNDRYIAAGIIDGRDMTTEAAFAKLHFLLANVQDRPLIGQLMGQNMRGEMILPDV